MFSKHGDRGPHVAPPDTTGHAAAPRRALNAVPMAATLARCPLARALATPRPAPALCAAAAALHAPAAARRGPRRSSPSGGSDLAVVDILECPFWTPQERSELKRAAAKGGPGSGELLSRLLQDFRKRHLAHAHPQRFH